MKTLAVFLAFFVASFALISPQPPKGAACTYCVWAVSYVQTLLAQNDTQAQIVSALNNQCSIFVIPDIVAQCRNFVNAYVPQIIQLLLKQVEPSTVCTKLNLCSSEEIVAASNTLNNLLVHPKRLQKMTANALKNV